MSGIMRLYENDGLTDYSRFDNLRGLSGTCDMYDMDSQLKQLNSLESYKTLSATNCNFTKSSTPPWVFFTFFKF